MKKLFLVLLLLPVMVAGVAYHKDSRTVYNHSPYRWIFSNAGARNAESVVAGDTDKVAYQKSDSTVWLLKDNDPKTWIRVGGSPNAADSLNVRTLVTIGKTLVYDSLKVGTDLLVVDDVKADSVYFRTAALSGNVTSGDSVKVGTDLVVTDDIKADSVYVRTLKTSAKIISTDSVTVGTDLLVTDDIKADSVYFRTAVLGGKLLVGSNYINNDGGTEGLTITDVGAATILGTAAGDGDATDLLVIADNTATAVGVGGGLLFRGKYNVGGTYATFAGIKGVKSNATAGNADGQLHLQTRLSSGNPVTRLIIKETGSVGIGAGSFANPLGLLDVASGGLSLVLGADYGATSRTNSADKKGLIGFAHYTDTEEPTYCIGMDNTSTYNMVQIGGGEGITNAATHIRFYTAANKTTVTGTERMTISSAGNVGIACSGAGTAIVDISGNQLNLGSDAGTTARTNTYGKTGLISSTHYTNAEEQVCGMYLRNTADSNIVSIGSDRGAGTTNAASLIEFWAGNTTTSTTGDLKMTVDVNGMIVKDGVSMFFQSSDESGSIRIYNSGSGGGDILDFGSSCARVYEDGGLTVGNPTGGNKGIGSINTVTLYLNGTAHTGYVIDKYFGKNYIASKWGTVPAIRFEDKAETCFNINKYYKYVKENKMLPEYAEIELATERPEVGDLVQRLWENSEVQAIHIKQLNDKLKILYAVLFLVVIVLPVVCLRRK